MTLVKNRLRNTLESGHFAVTAELTPPRGADFATLDAAINILGSSITAVNITDGAGARVRMSSLPAAIYMKQHGIEPILQMTCRDRNRIALQGDILGAAAFGIENILALTGDVPDSGDEKDAKAVFDFDSRGLVEMLDHMSKRGTTLSGRELSTAPDLFIGVADCPIDPASKWKPTSLLAKQVSGARFVQSQYCFDMELLARYLHRLQDFGLNDTLYYLVGLGPLRSAQAARQMRENLPGTVIPEGIIRRLEQARDARHEGTLICAELIQQAREINGIAGVHLMAPGMQREMIEAVNTARLA